MKVVQFNEKHKWAGCFGYLTEIKNDRLMVGVPAPSKGLAYIYCEADDIDIIGYTDLVPIDEIKE